MDESQPSEDGVILVQAPPKLIHEVLVHIADRTVVSYGTFRPSLAHVDIDGNPIIEGGIGGKKDHVIEQVSDETFAAILAAQPDHGAGVTLSADHTTVTANPETAASLEQKAARKRQEAEDAELAKLVAAHPDPVVQALAKRLGILPAPQES